MRYFWGWGHGHRSRIVLRESSGVGTPAGGEVMNLVSWPRFIARPQSTSLARTARRYSSRPANATAPPRQRGVRARQRLYTAFRLALIGRRVGPRRGTTLISSLAPKSCSRPRDLTRDRCHDDRALVRGEASFCAVAVREVR